jgi:hypothetical protein
MKAFNRTQLEQNLVGPRHGQLSLEPRALQHPHFSSVVLRRDMSVSVLPPLVLALPWECGLSTG